MKFIINASAMSSAMLALSMSIFLTPSYAVDTTIISKGLRGSRGDDLEHSNHRLLAAPSIETNYWIFRLKGEHKYFNAINPFAGQQIQLKDRPSEDDVSHTKRVSRTHTTMKISSNQPSQSFLSLFLSFW